MSNFAVIEHVDQIRQAIDVHNERLGVRAFSLYDRDSYWVANYNVVFAGSFPDVFEPGISDEEINHRKLVREIRGIMFDKESGRIISRPYHKFRNLGEPGGFGFDTIDIDQPHIILEKLDGSMFRPVPINVYNRWCTKMGITDFTEHVEKFVNVHTQYEKFANYVIDFNRTPIFEYCSRVNRIVIDHPEDRLVLTAIRDNITGEYTSYEGLKTLSKEFDIELVKALPGSIENLLEFVEATRAIDDGEGYVGRFDSGEMFKVKADRYCLLHSTKDQINQEKNVLDLILTDRVDDILPLLPPEDVTRVIDYSNNVNIGMSDSADRINAMVREYLNEIMNDPAMQQFEPSAQKGFVRKRFALDYASKHPREASIMFKLLDGHNPLEVVRRTVESNLGTAAKVESIRWLIGNTLWNPPEWDGDA